MKFVALGNENGCDNDNARIYAHYYTLFASRIRARHPLINLIANCDITQTSASGMVDLFDFHIYSEPSWFVANGHIFDAQDRTGPGVFVSEYSAAQQDTSNLQTAVAEAVFMVGILRNSDVVGLASHAVLFMNVNGAQQKPSLIQFDSSRVVESPAYWAQRLFVMSLGDDLLQMTQKGTPDDGSFAAIATYQESTGTLTIPLVNYSLMPTGVNITIVGSTFVGESAQIHVLTALDPLAQNTLDDPNNVVPFVRTVQLQGNKLSLTLLPYSIEMVNIAIDPS